MSAAAPPSPTYADIGHAVRVLDGVPAKRLRALMNAIFEQAAPPSSHSIDWSDPDPRLLRSRRVVREQVL